jgi:hypothetical protein
LIGEALASMDLQNRVPSSETRSGVERDKRRSFGAFPLPGIGSSITFGFQLRRRAWLRALVMSSTPARWSIDGTRHRADLRKKATGNRFQGYSVGSNGLASQIKAKASQKRIAAVAATAKTTRTKKDEPPIAGPPIAR